MSLRQRAAVLNNPIEVGEVVDVINRIKLGRAAGPDGIRAEFVKEAIVKCDFTEGQGANRPTHKNVLTPVIHAVMSAVFATGTYPVCWSRAAISAVFKKGDVSDKDNYRGIAVGNVLGKLYSMVIDTRLSKWSEGKGLRAEGQAGFRKGYRTTDQLLVLRHV